MLEGEYLVGYYKCPRTGCRNVVSEDAVSDFCSEHCQKLWLTNFNESVGGFDAKG